MTPQRILHDVKAVVPEDAHIFTDVGWNKNGVAQQFDVNVPGTIHHSSGLATLRVMAGLALTRLALLLLWNKVLPALGWL